MHVGEPPTHQAVKIRLGGLLAGVFALAIAPPSAAQQVLAATNPISPDTVKIEKTVPRLAAPLPPLVVKNINTNAEALVSLYAADRSVDPTALSAFRRAAALEKQLEAPLKTRVVQLVVKAAYDLGASKIILVSTVRPKDRRGRGGHHTTGEAVDFQLPGVPARTVAAYLRKLSRVGVGIYTHPKTQFVHLDVRDQSYHWLDASPPGRTWREAALKDATREERDAAYRPEDDLPKKNGG
jgi:uncharacterized protein YcbK (DUF882 family)